MPDNFFPEHLIDEKKSVGARGHIPIRLRRPPAAKSGETGFDTVLMKDLPRFLLDRWRECLKWQGPKALDQNIRHYQAEFKQISLFDQRTETNFEALADMIVNAPGDEKESILEEEGAPFLKSLEAEPREPATEKAEAPDPFFPKSPPPKSPTG